MIIWLRSMDHTITCGTMIAQSCRSHMSLLTWAARNMLAALYTWCIDSIICGFRKEIQDTVICCFLMILMHSWCMERRNLKYWFDHNTEWVSTSKMYDLFIRVLYLMIGACQCRNRYARLFLHLCAHRMLLDNCGSTPMHPCAHATQFHPVGVWWLQLARGRSLCILWHLPGIPIVLPSVPTTALRDFYQHKLRLYLPCCNLCTGFSKIIRVASRKKIMVACIWCSILWFYG